MSDKPHDPMSEIARLEHVVSERDRWLAKALLELNEARKAARYLASNGAPIDETVGPRWFEEAIRTTTWRGPKG